MMSYYFDASSDCEPLFVLKYDLVKEISFIRCLAFLSLRISAVHRTLSRVALLRVMLHFGQRFAGLDTRGARKTRYEHWVLSQGVRQSHTPNSKPNINIQPPRTKILQRKPIIQPHHPHHP